MRTDNLLVQTPSPYKRLMLPLTTRVSSSAHKRFNSELRLQRFSIDSTSLQEFFQEILKETRRISPVFSFKNSEGCYLSQILACFKKCVNQYLQKYSTQIIRNEKLENSEIAADESAKNQEILKNLLNLEKVLKRKEMKINKKSAEVKIELINLQRLVEGFEEEKQKWQMGISQEKQKLEEEKKNMLAECKQLEIKFSEIRKFYLELEKKESELKQLADDLSEEKSEFYIQRSELNKLAWEVSKKESDLETQESILKLKTQHLEQEKTDFENEKNRLEQENKNGLPRRRSINSLPRLFIKSPNELDKISDINEMSSFNGSFEHTFQSIGLFESRSAEAKDIEVAYNELNDKIEKINKEFEIREQSLQLREEEALSLRKDLYEKQAQLELVEQCLQESKYYLEEFNTQTIFEIEKDSNTLVALINSLNTQKSELQILVKQVHEDLLLINHYKYYLEAINEEIDEKASKKKYPEPDTIPNTINSDSD